MTASAVCPSTAVSAATSGPNCSPARLATSALVSADRSGSPASASRSRLSCQAPTTCNRGSGTRRRRPARSRLRVSSSTSSSSTSTPSADRQRDQQRRGGRVEACGTALFGATALPPLLACVISGFLLGGAELLDGGGAPDSVCRALAENRDGEPSSTTQPTPVTGTSAQVQASAVVTS